jgi:hypothetical protein
MSPTYHITEPHPSLPSSHYYHSGRGGAGNITYISNPSSITPGSSASGPASVTKLSSPSPNAYFMTGRGGAGNVHREKERAIFSFDEELAQQQRLAEHATPVYHIGRGGAGNWASESGKRKGSAASVSSNESDASGRGRKSLEGAWHKVARSLSRHS